MYMDIFQVTTVFAECDASGSLPALLASLHIPDATVTCIIAHGALAGYERGEADLLHVWADNPGVVEGAGISSPGLLTVVSKWALSPLMEIGVGALDHLQVTGHLSHKCFRPPLTLSNYRRALCRQSHISKRRINNKCCSMTVLTFMEYILNSSVSSISSLSATFVC